MVYSDTAMFAMFILGLLVGFIVGIAHQTKCQRDKALRGEEPK